MAASSNGESPEFFAVGACDCFAPDAAYLADNQLGQAEKPKQASKVK